MKMRDAEKGQVLIFAATRCVFFQPKLKIESIETFVLIAARLVFAATLIPGFASNLLRQTQTCSNANVHSHDSEN